MAEGAPDRRTEVPEAENPLKLKNYEYKELDDIVNEIMRDFKVEKEEVVPLTVAKFRREVLLASAKIDKLEEEYDKQVASKEAKENAKAPITRKAIDELEARIWDANESIGHEVKMLRTIQAMGKLQRDYKAAKKSMESFKFDPDVAGRSAKQEKQMDDQMKRIEGLLKKRAQIGTLKELYNRAEADGAKDVDKKRFEREAKDFYKEIGRKQPGADDIGKGLQQLDIQTDDELHAEVNFSSISLVKVEKMMRRLAWVTLGDNDDKLKKEITDFVVDMKKKKYEDNEDVKAAVTALELLLNKRDLTIDDVKTSMRNLPKKQPIAGLLLSDMLSSWADQLAENKEINKAARKDCVLHIHGTIIDLLRLQQVNMVELGGYEQFRTGYDKKKGVPKNMEDVLKRSPGLLESNRYDALARTEEIRGALGAYRGILAPTGTDRVRDWAGKLIVSPSKQLFKKMEKLMGTNILTQEDAKGMVEVLKGYDKKKIDALEDDMTVYEMCMKSDRMKPESFNKLRRGMSQEKAEALQKKADNLKGITPEIAARMIKEDDEESRFVLWLWLHNKIEQDITAFGDEQKKLFEELNKKGDADKNLAQQMREFGEALWKWFKEWMLVIILVIVAVVGAWKGAKYGVKRAVFGKVETTRDAKKREERLREEMRQQEEARRVREAEAYRSTLEEKLRIEQRLQDLAKKEAAPKTEGGLGETSPGTKRDIIKTRTEAETQADRVLREIAEGHVKVTDLSKAAFDLCEARVAEMPAVEKVDVEKRKRVKEKVEAERVRRGARR